VASLVSREVQAEVSGGRERASTAAVAAGVALRSEEAVPDMDGPGSAGGMASAGGTAGADGTAGAGTGAPRRRVKRVRKAVAGAVFVFLGRGLAAAAKHDSRVRGEVGSWPEGTVLVIGVAPDGPRMTVRKSGGKLEYLGGASSLTPTIEVEFKSIDVALPVLIGMKGMLQAFAEHRSILKGDIGLGMSIVRSLHIVEGYLFPDVIGKRVLPRAPHREVSRLAVYASTLTSHSATLQP
jgi:hypothetical protein